MNHPMSMAITNTHFWWVKYFQLVLKNTFGTSILWFLLNVFHELAFYRPGGGADTRDTSTPHIKENIQTWFTMKPYTIIIFDMLPQQIDAVLSAKCLIIKHITGHNMENCYLAKCFIFQHCIEVQWHHNYIITIIAISGIFLHGCYCRKKLLFS